MRRLLVVVSAVLAAAVAGSHAQPRPAPDLIVTGTIYTADPSTPRVEAMAVTAGRVAALGSRRDVLALRGDDTRVVDEPEGAVVPGLHDAHGHFHGLGESLSVLDLRDTASQAAVVEKVAARVAAITRDTAAGGRRWVVGQGWDQNDWPGAAWPTRAALDAVSSDLPVVLERIDGHASWVNTKALAIAGITRETADPDGGRVLRDAAGRPTGVLVDAAQQLVSRQVPPPTAAEIDAQILAADREMRRLPRYHDGRAGGDPRHDGAPHVHRRPPGLPRAVSPCVHAR